MNQILTFDKYLLICNMEQLKHIYISEMKTFKIEVWH